jgi:hypothetical protein
MPVALDGKLHWPPIWRCCAMHRRDEQPVRSAVLFSQNKPATSNQPAVFFSQKKST